MEPNTFIWTLLSLLQNREYFFNITLFPHYIFWSEITIDIHSNRSKICHKLQWNEQSNRLQNGHIDMKINHYCEIRREKARKNLLCPDLDLNPWPCAPVCGVWLHFAKRLFWFRSSGIQRPGKVAELWDMCKWTSRLPFQVWSDPDHCPVLRVLLNSPAPLHANIQDQ